MTSRGSWIRTQLDLNSKNKQSLQQYNIASDTKCIIVDIDYNNHGFSKQFLAIFS